LRGNVLDLAVGVIIGALSCGLDFTNHFFWLGAKMPENAASCAEAGSSAQRWAMAISSRRR
jgi:hypothetical protein